MPDSTKDWYLDHPFLQEPFRYIWKREARLKVVGIRVPDWYYKAMEDPEIVVQVASPGITWAYDKTVLQ